MKRLYLFLFFVFISWLSLHAQDKIKKLQPTYKAAIGLRYAPLGVSFKSNFDRRKAAIEIIGYFQDGFTAVGLYQWHFTLNKQRNLRGYLGGGGIIGFRNEEDGGSAVLGIAGVIGLDYKFLTLPINLSLDWQPALQIGSNDETKHYGGIGVRFTF